MKNELKINQLALKAFGWYEEYLAAVDSTDLEKYGAFLADDYEFQFANQPKIKGKTAILKGLKQFWASYDIEDQVLLNIFGTDHCFALEAPNIYKRKDGREVTCSAVAITERDEAGLVTSVRVFTNVAPLYS